MTVPRRVHAPERAHAGVLPPVHPLAVDVQLELLAGDVGADAEVADGEGVVPVAGKHVAHRHPPAGPQRHARQVEVLRAVGAGDVGRLGRGLPEPHGHAGDLGGGADVGLEQGRRDRQRPRDVVESAARVVGRQQGRGVDLQVEEVADDVGVLGPVQAVEDLGAGVQPGRPVELRFQPVPERRVIRLGRAAQAGRGHHAGPQLAHHLLPQLGVLADRGEIAPLERQVRGAVTVVVAGEAVPLNELAVRVRCAGRFAPLRLLLRPGRGGARDGRTRHHHETDDDESMQHRRLQNGPTRPIDATGRTCPPYRRDCRQLCGNDCPNASPIPGARRALPAAFDRRCTPPRVVVRPALAFVV